MAIKGPLGIITWLDTLSDDMCVKPTDLALLDQKEKLAEQVILEIPREELVLEAA